MLQFLSGGRSQCTVTFTPETSVSLLSIRGGSGGPKKLCLIISKYQETYR